MAFPNKEDAVFKTFLLCSIAASALAATSQFASAAEYASPDEARALLQQAVAEVRVDKQAAIDKFNRHDPQFYTRELSVFCFNKSDGRLTVHENFRNWDVRDLYDSWGAPFGHLMFLWASQGKVAEVGYNGTRPGSSDLVPVIGYVTVVGDQACGVNAYAPPGFGVRAE
jgi:hypothetical protein